MDTSPEFERWWASFFVQHDSPAWLEENGIKELAWLVWQAAQLV